MRTGACACGRGAGAWAWYGAAMRSRGELWIGALVGAVVVGTAAGEAGAAPVELAKLQLPGAPFDGIAITPDGKKLYVSLVAAKAPGKNTIAVVDTQTNTVAKVIDLGDQGADNSSPRQLYMSPDGGRLIHMTFVGNLLVIDTKTDTLLKTLPGVGKADAVFTPKDPRPVRNGPHSGAHSG